MLLETIDAADQRRLAGALWAANDRTLTGAYRQRDVAEHPGVAKILADRGKLDCRLYRGCHQYIRLKFPRRESVASGSTAALMV